MKKIFSLFLLCCMIFTFSPFASAFHGFTLKNTYPNNFSDVSESDWFYPYVKECYEYGLMKGSSDTTFSPSANLTLAEAIVIAVRMRSFYTTGNDFSVKVAMNEEWYDPYVNYAVNKGIVKAQGNYTLPAKRSEVADIFANALPEDAYPEILNIPDNYIPDVPKSAVYAKSIYKLYRAGILSGNDNHGTFSPDSAVKRSEIATICTRIANPEKRIKTLPEKDSSTTVKESSTPVISSEEISKKCYDAVFFIEIYGRNGRLIGSASGFFISKDGYAVTNCHVIENAGYIQIKMTNGKKYHGAVSTKENNTNLKVIDFDEEKDIALLKVDDGEFPYIETGDSRNLVQGQTVYAIGSPAGLENTMSMGIISRLNTGGSYSLPGVQISVPIAPGSSGGVLLNSSGEAIGITTGGIEGYAADLNWAVPIHEIESLDKYVLSPDALASDTHNLTRHLTGPFESATYVLAPDVIDFGAFSSAELLEGYCTLLEGVYRYDVYDFHDSFNIDASQNYATTLFQYMDALEISGFTFVKSNEDSTEYLYKKSGLSLGIYITYNDTQKLKKGLYIIYSYDAKYYEECPSVIDFGYVSFLDSEGEAEKLNGYYCYTYNWKEYYTEETALLFVNGYLQLLEQEGFKFYSDTLKSYKITSAVAEEQRIFTKGKSAVGVTMDNNNIYIIMGTR